MNEFNDERDLHTGSRFFHEFFNSISSIFARLIRLSAIQLHPVDFVLTIISSSPSLNRI